MSKNLVSFEKIKTSLENIITASSTSKKADRFDSVEKAYNSINLNDTDKRVIVENVIREAILKQITQKPNLSNLQAFVTFTIELSRREVCSPSIPIILLSDMFDMLTLDQCEDLFGYVEVNVTIWKEDLFFGSCKNNLLRMCNDMLRRLSRSQNTVFRGRILLFLAKFFPFSERSGLNVVSEFNLDSATEISEATRIDNFEEDLTEKKDGQFRIDYNLYNKFLILQDFCHSPNQCYNNVRWRVFINSVKDVLTAFKNFKLDDETWAGKSAPEQISEASDPMFIAKYLTNPKLFELQLSDPSFRRTMLIQLVILMQYLVSPVKFKMDSYELKPEQTEWVKQQVSLLYDLLAETPANSSKFAESVKHLLAREEWWNDWKNEGCPDFRQLLQPSDVEATKQKPKLKRKSIDILVKEAVAQKKCYMGHTELTRLWNLSGNNLNTCKSKERNFLPEIEEYFEESIMQMDPEAGIEPQYKKVNDPNFGWRALRLLAHKSPCFFTHVHVNKTIDTLPEYIEMSLGRLIKDKPTSDIVKQEPEEAEAEAEAEDEGEELLKGGEGEEPQEQQAKKPTYERLTSEMIKAVSPLVGVLWRKLGQKIGFGEEELNLTEKQYDSNAGRTESMLMLWSEEDEDATPDNFAYCLEGMGLDAAVTALKEIIN